MLRQLLTLLAIVTGLAATAAPATVVAAATGRQAGLVTMVAPAPAPGAIDVAVARSPRSRPGRPRAAAGQRIERFGLRAPVLPGIDRAHE